MPNLLNIFQGKKEESPPLWFMRQAGRYLPEYRDIRKKKKNFLELCYSPDQVVEITLQPLKRFDLDGVILFSDILTIPDALGQDVTFKEGEGPLLSPLPPSSFQRVLSFEGFFKKAAPVYEAIGLIRSQLGPSKTLLGFAGAPWTLALYMVEGRGSRDFAQAKTQAFQNEKQFSSFLDLLSEVVSFHLIEQVKAGAQVVQIFDTWAGHCPATHFHRWVLEPTQKIITSLHRVFPHIPIIGFPKGIGPNLIPYGHLSGVSALSLDGSIPLSWANERLPSSLIFQGNLDPLLLVSGGDPLKNAIDTIHQEMRGRPYIFNLGHGILPQTPIEHVEKCVKWVRKLR